MTEIEKDSSETQNAIQNEVEDDHDDKNDDVICSDENGEEVANSNQVKLSKNQYKKLLKKQKWEEKQLLKKNLKKLKKRKVLEEGEQVEEVEEEKKRQRIEENENTLNNSLTNMNEDKTNERKLLKEQNKNTFLSKCSENFPVVIDCSWENEHTESTLKSLTQQLMYCYGLNKKYDQPSRIFITGVGPKTLELLSKNSSQHWIGTTIHSEDFLDVLINYYNNERNPTTTPVTSTSILNKIVYLTSDAEEILEQLDNSTTYIIGGIVDRNRLKGITYKKAKELNIRTAKLPIKEHMKMAATHVLTINHVFDILKQYQINNSWKETLENVLPMRKVVKLSSSTVPTPSSSSSSSPSPSSSSALIAEQDPVVTNNREQVLLEDSEVDVN